MDEIYEAQYANLFDKVKGNMIHDVDFRNHKLYNEVQNMISSLDLAKFVNTVEVESSPRENLKEEEENERKEDFVREEGGDESEDRHEKDGRKRNETQEKDRREVKQEKRKSPLLRTEDQNKVQSRQNQNMVNLPKLGQELDIKRSLLLTNIRSQHDGRFKPTPESSSGSPLTGISNINVTTKADLNSLACKKSESTHIKEGIKNVLRKIKLSMSKKNDPRRERSLPIGVQNEDRPSLSNNQKRTYPSIPDQIIKSNRRRSLVGETLPKYIKNQLADNSNNFHIIENSSDISDQSKKVLYADGNSLDNASNRHASESPKLDSRIQNVMANSQSLYLNSKSSDRKTHERIHRCDNDRSVNGSTYGQHDEASVSNFSEEVDYILPSLFTKYYETLNADYDQGSREYEDSNVDFVNLNGSDDANSEPYENGQSDDDSYLFKI